MKMEALLEFAGLSQTASGWAPHRALEISGIASDHRRVQEGSLFVAVSGSRHDGHGFVADAARAGAAAAMVQHGVEGPIPQILVPDTRRAMGRVAAAFWGNPGERLYTVGITGTNGKTTTSHLVRGLLGSTASGVGLIGTVRYIVGGVGEDARYTTPEAVDIQSLLARMLQAEDASAVLEVSSHALALGRIEGLSFDVCCFTNLGRDHLDFHADMDQYLAVKSTLFTEHRKPGGTCVVNVDGTAGARLADTLEPPVIRVGISERAELRAEEIEVGSRGIAFTLTDGESSAHLMSPLQGLFNVENLLIAAGVGRAAGFELAHIAAVLGGLEGVEGRMERLDGPDGVLILLDYAHKPDALRGALQACRELGTGRLLVVFGCGGDRDRGKRPLMGRIAALGADRVFVTSDNPRSEDPGRIIEEIMEGVPAEADVTVEADRRVAIALAVAEARPGDVVLVAGKGHEQYQILGTERIPFDERAVVAEAVAAARAGGRS